MNEAVGDNGQYMPVSCTRVCRYVLTVPQPSPTEKPSSWYRSPTTTASHRSALNDNEPFSISRESFDSYRRSFVRAMEIGSQQAC